MVQAAGPSHPQGKPRWVPILALSQHWSYCGWYGQVKMYQQTEDLSHLLFKYIHNVYILSTKDTIFHNMFLLNILEIT